MISQNKKIILFASAINITGTGAITVLPNSTEDIDIASKQFKKVDFVIDIKAINAGSASFSFQECFNDNAGADVWVETANSGVKAAVARTLVTNGSSGRTGDIGSNPMLGEGGSKKIVVTGSGSVTSSNVDVYAVFTN